MEKIERYRRKRSHGQKEPGQQEKERGEKKTLLSLLGQREGVEGKREWTR